MSPAVQRQPDMALPVTGSELGGGLRRTLNLCDKGNGPDLDFGHGSHSLHIPLTFYAVQVWKVCTITRNRCARVRYVTSDTYAGQI